TVLDVNEYEPKSIMHTYRCYTYDNVDRKLPVCRIIAFDRDQDQEDDQCQLGYLIVEGNEKRYFRLDEDTGLIYPAVDPVPKGGYDFIVQISDCGRPAPLNSTVHVIVRVLPANTREHNSRPVIEPFDSTILINRNEEVGYTVAWIRSF